MPITYKKNIGAWKYSNDGDSVEGKIFNIQKDVEVKNQKYKYNIYTIEKSEVFIDIFGCKVIDDEFTKFKFEVGDHIKIIYKGIKKGKNEEYKDFEVYRGMDMSSESN